MTSSVPHIDETRARATPTPAEPLPAAIRSVQPGGGWCYQIELAWGRWRRWYLRRFRPGYVERMAIVRRGSLRGAPHDILDPRDLKYCANQCTAHWDEADDPFSWRERLPFARWGLAELVLLGSTLAALTALALWTWWPAAIVPALLLAEVVYFFRDPPRRVPPQPGLLVAPADGKVVDVTRLEHDDWIGGPAVRIGIFLSIFNVHVNRAPCAARVIRLVYRTGAFRNALDPRSLEVNENLWIGMEEPEPPYRRLAVRQIAGAIARRIVCTVRPDEVVERGQRFGMIKLGSRTELLLADEPQLEILTQIGQHVRAGSSIVARYHQASEVNG